MSEPLVCDMCGQPIRPAGDYVVKIAVFANPGIDPEDLNILAQGDFADEWDKVIAELNAQSAQEAQWQTHQAFEYHVCPECRCKFAANPLGLPRIERPGKN